MTSVVLERSLGCLFHAGGPRRDKLRGNDAQILRDVHAHTLTLEE